MLVLLLLFSISETNALGRQSYLHNNLGPRVTHFTDFIGFSYSRAILPPISKRFVHFGNEVKPIIFSFFLF